MLWSVSLFFLQTLTVAKVTVGDIVCSNTQCPKEAPFCTEAGCVKKCPENSYVKGSRCVLDCGSQVVDGIECRDACPAEKNIIHSKVSVIGNTFSKLRICTNYCDIGLFIYNNTCVETCPDVSKNVVQVNEGKKCVATCPGSFPIKNAKSTKIGTTYFECLNVCYYPTFIVRNNTCVTECNEGDVVFNNTCVSKCPEDFQYLQIMLDRKKHCVKSCEGDYYLEQDCVQYCPSETVIANKSCVKSCPKAIPFALSKRLKIYDYIQNQYVSIAVNKCVEDCPTSMFIQNSSCTNACPSYIFNRTCVQACPQSFPFSSGKQCIEQCPKNKFIHNFACLTHCPHVSYYDKCLPNCPNMTFRENNRCVHQCEQYNFMYNNGTDCVSNCPEFSYDNNCVTSCPETTLKEDRKCVHQCRKDMFRNGDECVLKCPSDTYIYNKTCIKECPLDAPYEESRDQDKVCLRECKGSFAINFTCVKHCPKRIVYNQCVDECPTAMPLIEKQNCVDKCSDSNVANGSICIRKNDCDHPYFVYNGNCLEMCPKGMQWISNNMYYNNCQSVWIVNGILTGSLVLMVALGVTFVKFFRFQPVSCLKDCIRSGRKMANRRPSLLTRYTPVSHDETANNNCLV